jgi:hypothetical protein
VTGTEILLEKSNEGGCDLQGIERSEVHTKLVEKLEGNTPLGRTRRRWEDNIKMSQRNRVEEWRAFVNTAVNLWVP